MKRITLWVLSTLTVVVLLFGYKTSTAGPLSSSGPQASSSQHAFTATASGATSAPSASQPATGTPSTAAGGTSGTARAKARTRARTKKATAAPTPTPAAAKTVTGSVVETRWGPVQVQLSIAGGTISKVSVLQYPAGNPRDEEINAYALPILTQETVDAQSAQIDMISGATVTSDGYVRSLQSALDQAGL